MATTDLYSNEMLADMIAKLTDTVAAVLDLKTVVAQGVTQMTIKAGATITKILNAADLAISSDAWVTQKTIKSFSNGSITFAGTLKGQNVHVNTAYNVYLGYSIDNGATWVTLKTKSIPFGQTQQEAFTYNIPMTVNGTVLIGLKSVATITTATILAGATLKYDITDVVAEQGLSIL